MNCNDFANLQNLYLDQELDAPEAAMVEAHLQLCAACRALADRARVLKSAIRRKAHRYAAPLDLGERIRRDISARRERPFSNLRYLTSGWNPIAIAATLLLTIATSSGLTAAYVGTSSDERVVEDVISSHVRSLMADHLTDVASSDQHTVKPWFSGKVAASPPAVDLASAGFPLVGGRLDYVADHPCAALVYRHDKHVINVMVWANDSNDAEATETYARQGYNLIHTSEDNLDYWVVSDLDRTDLANFVGQLMSAAHAPDTRT
ncbi:MAG TPA: anti-sigma factor [Stellaceae bacterium]|jgi:anti-sigma factor RsiW|nr:anti-sigma factor [Stellaceae bacterium]